MYLQNKLQEYFTNELNLPISSEEIFRYTRFLENQEPGHNLMPQEELEKLVTNRRFVLTPLQILKLWNKSENLIKQSGSRRRKKLSELMAVAIFAQHLNNRSILSGDAKMGFPIFQSSLFSLEIAPKSEERPDVYLSARSHRNRNIPNLGSMEARPIEVTEYEINTFSQKPQLTSNEAYLTAFIGKKINKKLSDGTFPYSSDTRLIINIVSTIDISTYDFARVTNEITLQCNENKRNGFGTFLEVGITQYNATNPQGGKVIMLYPHFEISNVKIKHPLYNDAPLYYDPLFSLK